MGGKIERPGRKRFNLTTSRVTQIGLEDGSPAIVIAHARGYGLTRYNGLTIAEYLAAQARSETLSGVSMEKESELPILDGGKLIAT